MSPQALCSCSSLSQLFQKGWFQNQKLLNTVVLGGWLIHCWLVSWLCVLGAGGGIRYSGRVSLCNSTFFFLEDEAVIIFLDKSIYSTTLLLVRFPPSKAVMSSFSLGHMNSPWVLFVPPGARQRWPCVCNLLTPEILVFFSILSWAEPFGLDAVFQLYLRVCRTLLSQCFTSTKLSPWVFW